MAETIEDYYARVMAATDDEDRLSFPAEGIPYWEIFPFEAEGLRLKRMDPLAESEEPRDGELGRPCRTCSQVDERNSVDAEVWRDDHWRITVSAPSGAPLILMLVPQTHHDFTTAQGPGRRDGSDHGRPRCRDRSPAERGACPRQQVG